MKTGKRSAYLIFCSFCLAAVLAVSLFSGVRPAQAAADRTTVVLVSGASHEDCSVVGPGQTLNFSYVSSKPVAFAIHYHWHGKTISVYEKKPLITYDGKYSPKQKHEYCLMFTDTNYPSLLVNYTKSVIGK